jgi:DNA-binding MarR family transcriptional regulator
MRAAEELRFLILAIQREGNRALADGLKPLGVTPSQAEVVRLLNDHGPLSLSALGGLLVCETGTSPSRLVDRLVSQHLVAREVDAADRRFVTIELTAAGRRLNDRIIEVEQRLYALIDGLVAEQPVPQLLDALRVVAGAFPIGAALARRRALDNTR